MQTILLAEDDPLQRRMVRRMLESCGAMDIIEVSDGAEALQRLSGQVPISLALIDLSMPVLDGKSLLRHMQNNMPHVPCIVLTGSDAVSDAVEAMRLGAADFLTKPPQAERLIASVRNAMALRDLRVEVSRLKQSGDSDYHFDTIEQSSPGLQAICALGRKAAGSTMPVLITGESGVGKEVLAHAIHRAGNRAEKPFISINCGALPENLEESTLFGHEKGAFTGATAKSLGKCREAEGGVLFLDEVGELKPQTQVKLLRLLQEGEIEPVGSAKPLKVNVRIISATNRALEQMVAQGRFREDLYYRLQGLPLHIPPLRERRRDIPLLAHRLLNRLAMAEGRVAPGLTPEAESWLSSYRWPGNVRELKHVLSRALLLAESNVLDVGDLARWISANDMGGRPSKDAPPSIMLEKPNGQLKSMEEIEQEVMEAALMYCGAHVGRAAAALGIGQSTLYKKLRK